MRYVVTESTESLRSHVSACTDCKDVLDQSAFLEQLEGVDLMGNLEGVVSVWLWSE